MNDLYYIISIICIQDELSVLKTERADKASYIWFETDGYVPCDMFCDLSNRDKIEFFFNLKKGGVLFIFCYCYAYKLKW